MGRGSWEAAARWKMPKPKRSPKKPPRSEVELNLYLQKLNAQVADNAIPVELVVRPIKANEDVYACYDPNSAIISIQPVFLKPKVPDFYVNYLIWHEFLHAFFWQHHRYGGHDGAFGWMEASASMYGKAMEYERSPAVMKHLSRAINRDVGNSATPCAIGKRGCLYTPAVHRRCVP